MECMLGIALSSLVSSGVISVASLPEILSTKYVSSPCQMPFKAGLILLSYGRGSEKVSPVVDARADLIASLHIGATIKPATFFSIGVLSLFPAQVPITISGV